LSIDRRTLLEALVQEHLKQHGDDPQQSLGAVSSIESVRQDLEQLADSDVAASLVHVSLNAPAADDPFATRPGSVGETYATRAGSVGETTSSGTRFRNHSRELVGRRHVAGLV
jgi:hypothetical protein